MEIATRRRPPLRVICGTCASSPTNKNLRYGAFPPDTVPLRSTLPVWALVLFKTSMLPVYPTHLYNSSVVIVTRI